MHQADAQVRQIGPHAFRYRRRSAIPAPRFPRPAGRPSRPTAARAAWAMCAMTRASETSLVTTGVRPGGSSSMTDTSRSANAPACVRGMGVALMLSWCGTMRPRTVSSWSAPGAGPRRSDARRRMDRPSRWNSTWSWISACVPTSCISAALGHGGGGLPRLGRQAAGHPGDVHAQRLQPRGELAEVLFGQDFGGAISATWAPRAMAWAAAMAARSCRCPRRPATGDDRIRLRQVCGDFRTTLLRASQLNGTAGPPARPAAGGSAASLMRAARGRPTTLLRQQLVELDAPPCRVNPFQQRLPLALRRRVQRGWRLEQQRIALRATGGKVSDRSARSSACAMARRSVSCGRPSCWDRRRERGGQRRIGVDHARVHHLAANRPPRTRRAGADACPRSPACWLGRNSASAIAAHRCRRPAWPALAPGPGTAPRTW